MAKRIVFRIPVVKQPSFGPSPMWSDKPTRDPKRSLGTRDKQIVYKRDKYRCQACGKKVEMGDENIGHRLAWSKGHRTTVANSVLLCYGCNRRQGTDSLITLKKKLGKYVPKEKKSRSERKKTRRSKSIPI